MDDNKFSWFVPWIAGWLFTLGFYPLEQAIVETLRLHEFLLYLLFSYFIWPVLLGSALGGN